MGTPNKLGQHAPNGKLSLAWRTEAHCDCMVLRDDTIVTVVIEQQGLLSGTTS